MNACENPIVIVGCRRSGTTLLQAVLKEHPDLLVHPQEVQFFLEMSRHFGSQIQDVPAAIDYLCTHPFRANNVTPESLNSILGSRSPISLADCAQAYLQSWAEGNTSDRRLVIKHPLLILHLELVYELFPKAALIHMVRDPRANIASQRARWNNATLRECIIWWQSSIQNGWSQAQNDPGTFLEIRYEDLVLSPAETIQQVCEFIDIPFTNQLLDFKLKTRAYQSGEKPEHKTYTQVDPSRLERWRQNLSEVDICLIENACQQEMRWWDYQPEAPDVSTIRLISRDLPDRISYGIKSTGRSVRRSLDTRHLARD